MSSSTDATKAYLEYLDKEMTIMGILSTFCVAAAALVIERVGNAEKGTLFRELLYGQPVVVFSGAAALLIAGLCFYLQRSRLAHYYGGICMSMTGLTKDEGTTAEWLEEAYSWRTWRRYRAGFGFLSVTGVFFLDTIFWWLHGNAPKSHLLLWPAVAIIFIAIAVDAYTLTERVRPNPLLKPRKRKAQAGATHTGPNL